MTIEVTLKDVRRHCLEIVREKGDEFIYPVSERGGSCRYVWHGEPDCLVGIILARMGVPIERLSECEGDSGSMVLDHLHEHGVVGDIERGVRDYLSTLQRWQDEGKTYGIVLQAGELWLSAYTLGQAHQKERT